MKYYIVGKKIKEGNLNSDSEKGNLNEYFELGWEYISSHLHIKHLFFNKLIKEDDIIVTLNDRMFFYSGFCNNVISYEDFEKMEKNNLQIIDICNEIQKNQIYYLPKITFGGKYENWEKEKDIITNINYKNVNYLGIQKDFCCLHIRYRKWAPFRNFSEDFWKKIIKEIELSGLKIFVFGKEAEKFCSNKNIIHVGLQEYASLLNNEKCKFLIGNMSGGTLVAQLFSNINCKNYVIIGDMQTYSEFMTMNSYRVFYHIKEMNFSNAPISYVTTLDSVCWEDFITVEKMLNEIK